MQKTDSLSGTTFKTPAIIAWVIGVVGSIALFLVAGRGAPASLRVLMFGWVVTPFLGFAALAHRSRWRRPALNIALILVATISLMVYSYAVYGSPAWKPAFPFVAMPVVAWIILALVFITGTLRHSAA